jgi:hypothetical protein
MLCNAIRVGEQNSSQKYKNKNRNRNKNKNIGKKERLLN